ncbi:MAG: response regulator transcription factor [Candidatus Dormibacteraceae bacterium]
MSGGSRILVVEDDEGIRETLKYHLNAAGFQVLEAADGPSGLRAAHTAAPDLILLDVMLPGMSGIEVTRALRRSSQVPILILTAVDAEVDRVLGLDLGADDYITKPFSIREVIARVSAVLRRGPSERVDSVPDREELADFVLDRPARRVQFRGSDVRMTTREFDLLAFLLAHPGRVHSRSHLLAEVWGPSFGGESKTVDVHIRWLREKFGGAQFQIVTVRGCGYRLDR